ncbi:MULTISPECIES: helix-turn-helix transcriptional regulator [unclassified Streptomyces]|uniref:helix-turn-helix domain-containing protein n=1 Tax=unclassified Streptomyces TaxID=2593676 RepID=UPI0033F71566
MHRLDNGHPLRDAMTAAGLSIERLAEKTKQVDPAGYGISQSAIGNMVSTGTSGRDRFSRRSCDLVARALERPAEDFFTERPI